MGRRRGEHKHPYTVDRKPNYTLQVYSVLVYSKGLWRDSTDPRNVVGVGREDTK